MAYRNGPKVVTDGLVLCLDAAISKSYPGSGSTWYDTSVSKSNASLVNSPTFNSSKRGYIACDGIDDYANFYVPNLTTVATIESFAYIDSTYLRMFCGFTLYDVYMVGSRLGYNTAASDLYGMSAAQVSSVGAFNNWNHFIFEMRSDVSYTNNKIYINGVSQSLSQQLGSENAGSRNFSSGNGRICGWRASTGYPSSISYAYFRIYNRILSQDEITQNFNATRGRFGV